VDEIATNTTEQANQPQDQQNHQNCPQHVEISFLYRPKTLKNLLDPTTESNLEMSNVHANARFAKLPKKTRKHTGGLHHNHPVFHPGAELCFESVQ
jgi:hypothetical protein